MNVTAAMPKRPQEPEVELLTDQRASCIRRNHWITHGLGVFFMIVRLAESTIKGHGLAHLAAIRLAITAARPAHGIHLKMHPGGGGLTN
jgi:hypothetical protein